MGWAEEGGGGGEFDPFSFLFLVILTAGSRADERGTVDAGGRGVCGGGWGGCEGVRGEWGVGALGVWECHGGLGGGHGDGGIGCGYWSRG